ncbi:MAG: amidohydrolase family protein [Candidatus Eisenbacteria bacterium]
MRRLSIALLLMFSILPLAVTCKTCRNPVSDGGSNHSPNETIAVTNGFLIDGTGSSPLPDAVIIIQDGYIESVGTPVTIEIPAGASSIDLEGAYILPGFMNTHVHSGYDENNLKQWAKSGVTTVRDLGNFTDTPGEAFSRRSALLRDNENSRLVAAGPMVTTVGGYGNYEVTSPVDARAKVNGLIDSGADLIKIAIEDNLQGRNWPMLSLEEITAIVQTAHARDRQVSAHVSRSSHLDMAVKSGVADVAHMVVDVLPDSLISAMIEKDIYWVPTLELWKGVSEYHDLDWDDIAKDNLGRFARAGGKVALGTDFDGYIIPFELGMPILEMQLMLAVGMTPMEIIVAGTRHAAHVCDMDSELGTIEPGKIADLIAVDGNPLDDLESLLSIELVIHNGEIIIDNTVY